ncbi:O-acetyl-ADP-ribose deacetylase [Amnibacterium flavum]|uniref:O-acetyl-ADP-ribose deacetylase n=1 Tax=Amnibacterium flavum TaxID=2173173 RepID=A0A2V1HRS1_9MICO|nr:O-acetyl-ADP-ribose deacetylase [Amnibacterium flavum]PVZ93660.1 O-acetyl-ADP-ribose deacetylase [Amnibacterium flavum]
MPDPSSRAEDTAPTRLEAVRGDITRQSVDVIVNAANSSLLGGGGVDGAIHRAGGPEILAECRELRAGALREGLPTGDAVATTAGRLPARWVVHTVGPVYAVRTDRRPLLESAYRRSIEVSAGLGARSIAFPAVSAGVYGWPPDDSARLAVTAVRAALAAGPSSVELVRFVLFSDEMHELFAAELSRP